MVDGLNLYRQHDIRLHEDLVYLLEEAKRQRRDAQNDLRGELGSVSVELHSKLDLVTQTSTQALLAQEKTNKTFEDLPGLILAGHDTLNDKLDAIQILMAEMRLQGSQVRSSTILTAPTEDVLGRIFRAELRRVIMPTVQQCFDTYKSNPDSQLDEIKRSIDQMTQLLGSKASAHACDNGSTTFQMLPEAVHENGQTGSDLTGIATAGSMDATAFSRSDLGSQDNVRYVKQWRHSWIFRWAIGTLCVTLSTSVTKQKRSTVFRVGNIPVSQNAYRVNIDFQPAQSLIFLRGLSMSVASPQDQRGYYQICPLLSSFAVVPWNAEVMVYARTNNVEGLQDLFARRLAAPSDRDDWGSTPLMVCYLT